MPAENINTLSIPCELYIDVYENIIPDEDMYDMWNAPVEEMIHVPMIHIMVENGITPNNAKLLFNCIVAENPYIALYNIPIFEYSEGPDIDPLTEAYITAHVMTNGKTKFIDDAVQYPNCEIATEAIIQKIADSQPVRFVRRVANDVKHTINPIGQSLMNAVHNLQKQNEEMNREMVISGSYLLKIRHIFKKILLYMVAKPFIFALIPGGPIGLLASLVYSTVKIADVSKTTFDTVFRGSHANLEPETKNRVIQELELELKMVREKIEDAKSAGDKQSKYQLMRLENKIEMEIKRVKYGQQI